MWISSREAAQRLFEVVDTKPAVSEQAPANKIIQITNYKSGIYLSHIPINRFRLFNI